MPKRTYKDLEKRHGVSRDKINAAKSMGVNIWDDKAMDEWLSTRRPKVKKGAKIPPKDPAVTAQTIDAIKTELQRATDYDTVKILGEKLKGLQTAAKLQKELRELVPVSEVDERDIRIASVVKAGILKLCNDAAPMAEGLDAARIHKVLMDAGHDVLAMMADQQSEFWKGDA